MKKLYVLLLIAILTPIAVYAWNDCPYGLLNDPFPGQCPRYVDTNHDNICDHSQSPGSKSTNTSSSIVSKGNVENGSNRSFSKINKAHSISNENYYLLPLTTTLTIIYLISYLLYLEKRLKRRIYYKIWNIILILSFLVTGVTGLLMVIFINYGIQSSWNLTIDFWHAEFAIIMAFSTLFHFHLYWKQLKKIF
ncbi:MAG: DUF4405 domain-containing protein [Methanobacteriaceae archaeon]|nr:DUF4405 domain-containing protein [Methanobacteriaceae archaeon]